MCGGAGLCARVPYHVAISFIRHMRAFWGRGWSGAGVVRLLGGLALPLSLSLWGSVNQHGSATQDTERKDEMIGAIEHCEIVVESRLVVRV
jgi:hypothetical protein